MSSRLSEGPAVPLVLVCGPDLDSGSGAGIQQHVKNLVAALTHNCSYKARAFAVTSTVYSEPWLVKVGRGVIVAAMFFRAVGQVSLVHLNTTIDNRSLVRDAALMLLARVRRTPVVTQFHGGSVSRLSPFVRRWIAPVMRWSALCLFLTKDQAAEFSDSAGVRVTRIVNNGVDGPDVLPDRTEQDDEPLRVAYLGRLDPDKGLSELMDAVLTLGGRVKLRIAGDGPLRQEVAHLGESAPYVEYVGFVTGEGKRELLSWASVIALPSHAEAMPYAVLEAMSYGMAVVATPVGRMREVVGADAGILVPVGNRRALTGALDRLASDRAEVRAMGRRARQRWHSEYSLERLASTMVDVYASALAHSGAES